MTLETYNEKHVRQKFGEQNYNTIIQDCEDAKIGLSDLLEITKQIDERGATGLYGHVKRNEDKDFRLLCRSMFHFWYKVDPNGVQLQKFAKILNDGNVKQKVLALKLEENCKSMAVLVEAPGPDPEIPQVQVAPEIPEIPQVQVAPETPQFQVGEGNESATIVANAFKNSGRRLEAHEVVVNKGNREALLIGNTYKRAASLERLPGCEESVIEMKKALGKNLQDKGKTAFVCNTETNLSVDQIQENVKNICKDANDESAGVLLVYISGHGGHESLELKSNNDIELEGTTPKSDGMKYLLKTTDAFVSEGGNFIWGEINGKLEGKLYKNQLIAQICKDTKNVGHRIIIFDCCRGDRKEEKKSMSAKTVATLKVEFTKLIALSNEDYKNTFVFNSTLQHQVAWSDDLMTTFCKYFVEFVGGKGGVVDINCLDIAINGAIKKDMPKGAGDGHHVQMVELIKWVDQPFIW